MESYYRDYCEYIKMILENQNYHEISPHMVRMAIIKKNPQTTNVEEGVDRRECSYTIDVNVNWYSHYGEQYGGSLKN